MRGVRNFTALFFFSRQCPAAAGAPERKSFL
jgi:hypothetical protein